MILKIIELIDDLIEYIKKPVYILLIVIIYVTYFLIYIGFIKYNPNIINNIHIYLQLFIGFFLFIKFFPYRKYELKEYDSNIIFTTSIILLTNLGIVQLMKNYFHQSIVTNWKTTTNPE